MSSRSKKQIVALAMGLACLAAVTQARGDDWSVLHSWRWPLYVRAEVGTTVQTGEPRVAVWTSNAEYQNYGSRYLHPGIDIRGDHGDPALMPTDATVEHVYNYGDQCLLAGWYCRLWFKSTDDHYLYYVSHVDIAPTPLPGGRLAVTEIREQIQNAQAGMGDTSVQQGDILATLAMFGGYSGGWHHLHFGVNDRMQDYALVDALQFFEEHPSGMTGESMFTIDADPPVVEEVRLVQDGAGAGASAVTSGLCGDEVWGQLDIEANIYDTFITQGTFATFTGKDTWPSTTGIRKARYLVRSIASGDIVQEATWYDMAKVPMTCSPSDTNRNCLIAGDPVNDSAFFTRMGVELGGQGAPSAGLSVLDTLFDTGFSESQYDVSGGETYWHILTNSNATDGSWDVTGLGNGRYQVSVEAEDFGGRRAAKTMFVTVHDPATTLDLTQPGFGDVYIKDHSDDLGEVPSNLGGRAFWQSPDILIYPKGTAVTVSTPAIESLVTAGAEYDVYVRFRNNGCTPVSGVKARVMSADPSALSIDWRPITPAGTYVGDAANPDGVTVDAGGVAMLGPFDYIPTAEDAQYGGHRCMLADIDAPSDPLAAGNEFDAPNQNNVGQRNLQVGNCLYLLPNPDTSSASVEITLSTDAEPSIAGTFTAMTVEYDPAWHTAWSGVTGVEVSQVGSLLQVRMLVDHVTLPSVVLPAGATRHVGFIIDLPDGTSTKTLQAEYAVNGSTVSNGTSCSGEGGPIIY